MVNEFETANDDEQVITLVDEEGKSHEFQVVDFVEVNGKEYALLYPAEGDEESEEDEEVLVLRVADDQFEMIDNDEEFQAVVAHIEAMSEEEA
jgi:uncharacterized protein YrzB (UPF0473 family)